VFYLLVKWNPWQTPPRWRILGTCSC